MKRPRGAKPFNLILLGDPASGKATQAARIVKRYGLHDFDMGHELRKPETRARFDYASMNAKGNLSPTWVVRDILRRTIESMPSGKGILFDGHPKMIGEAKMVAALLRKNRRRDPLVVYLRVPVSERLRRIRKRARDDDTPEAIRGRARYYRNQVSRVVSYFRKRYVVKRVSGTGSRDEVWKRIKTIIDRYGAQDA